MTVEPCDLMVEGHYPYNFIKSMELCNYSITVHLLLKVSSVNIWYPVCDFSFWLCSDFTNMCAQTIFTALDHLTAWTSGKNKATAVRKAKGLPSKGVYLDHFFLCKWYSMTFYICVNHRYYWRSKESHFFSPENT